MELPEQEPVPRQHQQDNDNETKGQAVSDVDTIDVWNLHSRASSRRLSAGPS